MGKKSTDVKGGITKPKSSKSSASKHAATATQTKPKKESTEKNSASLKKGASEQHKEVNASKKSKSSSEIDGLFGQLKGATATAAAADKSKQKNKNVAEQKSASAKRPKIEGNKDDIFGTETGQARKKTEEGYNIYREDELGLGKKGGDTDNCPFDCDCCF